MPTSPLTRLQREQSVVCSLQQDDFADRRAEWARLGNEALREAHATSTGVRLVYSSTEGVEERLRELARLEVDCCGFAEWKVVRRGTQVVLDVRAEGAGVAAVQALIGRS